MSTVQHAAADAAKHAATNHRAVAGESASVAAAPSPGPLVGQLSPAPLLAAVEAFRGRWIDIDRGADVGPDAFRHGWRELTRQMQRLGLRPLDRVLLALGNGPLFPAALAAILAGGGSPLLLHVDTPPAELKRTALRYGARFVVCDAPSPAELQPAVAGISTVTAADWGSALWGTLDPRDAAFDADWPPLPGVPLHPTSGTTGRPKLAARPARAALADGGHFIQSIGIDAADVLLVAGPMSHMYTYGFGVMVPLLCGATCVSMRRFQPRLVHQTVAAHRVTILPTVPAMLDVLLFGAGARLRRFVRQVFVAGAPLPERTARNFWKAAAVLARPHYGATETGGITVADAAESAHLGRCVGRPLQGVTVEIRPSRHADLPAGTGTVCIRSDSLMAGYLGRDGLDTSSLEGGWFRSSDLGACDATGAVYLQGRENEVINVAGLKVIPSEVEEVIATLPGVTEVKVYAGAYPSGAQYVKAAVVARPSLDAAAVRAHCHDSLVYYKRPQHVAIVAALPRSTAGKVVLAELP